MYEIINTISRKQLTKEKKMAVSVATYKVGDTYTSQKSKKDQKGTFDFHFNEIPTSRAPYKTRAHAIRAPTF